MEFLTTPDLPSKWPTTTAHPSTLLASTPAKPSETPRPPLDRATIKSSFQSLFNPSPNVATPALMRAPGLTPFINGMPTPGLPTPGLMPPSTFLPHTKPDQSMTTPSALSTPLLQAAAKEAVRREFTNMPSYVATPQSFERVVPTTSPGDHKQTMQVVVQTGAAAAAAASSMPPSSQPAPQTVPQQPLPASQQQTSAQPPVSAPLAKSAATAPYPTTTAPLQQAVPTQADMSLRNPNPFFFPAQPPGMVLMGQHGMMIPPAPMYPPGMMVFPTSHPSFPAPGLMFPNQNVPNTRVSVPKSETPAERKARIELEKQELIREFKKKTREAALVRFRQKRRERRFGKLIRYDCRKKLADARPRVKGRFVRIKADEDDSSEGAQVVPNMH